MVVLIQGRKIIKEVVAAGIVASAAFTFVLYNLILITNRCFDVSLVV